MDAVEFGESLLWLSSTKKKEFSMELSQPIKLLQVVNSLLFNYLVLFASLHGVVGSVLFISSFLKNLDISDLTKMMSS